MSKQKPSSEKYEDLTRQILNDDRIRPYLALAKVEAYKHTFIGKKTGTEWEVDAFGYDLDGGLVLIECKHYGNNTGKLKQNQLAGFAYTIQDIGAKRGIVVTTLGLQEGAQKVAEAENITLIKLSYNSNLRNFIIDVIEKKIIQITDKLYGSSLSGGGGVFTQFPEKEILRIERNKVEKATLD